MKIKIKPIYKRILLKLSGEILQGSKVFGIDVNILDRLSLEIKELVGLAVQIGIVIGGGNLFRGADLATIGIKRVVGDHIGMLATAINGLAICDALHRAYVKARLMSAIPLNGICDNYSHTKAINLLCNGIVVIFSTGTGNPFFTTDSAACLRGIEIEADVILKATKVDGVYFTGSSNTSDLIFYDKLTYQDVLKHELKVMDLAAFTLARDYNLPIHVFNVNKPGALYRIMMGENEGTLISI